MTHQFRAGGGNRRGMSAAGRQADQSRTGTQCGLPRQAQRAIHAMIAPDHEHMTVGALVRGARTRRLQHPQRRRRQQLRRRRQLAVSVRRHAKIGERDPAGELGRLTGIQALFAADEGDRPIRFHGGPEHRAAVGVQAARNINCQHRDSRPVDRLDHGQPFSLEGTVKPGPEQGVHDHLGIRQPCKIARMDLPACRQIGIARGQRIAADARGLARLQNRDTAVRLQCEAGKHIAVAPVIAGAAYHDDATGLGPVPAQGIPGHRARPRHQGVAGNSGLLDRRAVEFAHLLGGV